MIITCAVISQKKNCERECNDSCDGLVKYALKFIEDNSHRSYASRNVNPRNKSRLRLPLYQLSSQDEKNIISVICPASILGVRRQGQYANSSTKHTPVTINYFYGRMFC